MLTNIDELIKLLKESKKRGIKFVDIKETAEGLNIKDVPSVKID
jgi:hypothetical protein